MATAEKKYPRRNLPEVYIFPCFYLHFIYLAGFSRADLKGVYTLVILKHNFKLSRIFS